MNVEVKLYAALRQYRPRTAGGAPHHSFVVQLPEESTIASLITHLAIPKDMVTAAGRNDDAVDISASLHDGDTVRLFPPTAGGAPGGAVGNTLGKPRIFQRME